MISLAASPTSPGRAALAASPRSASHLDEEELPSTSKHASYPAVNARTRGSSACAQIRKMSRHGCVVREQARVGEARQRVAGGARMTVWTVGRADHELRCTPQNSKILLHTICTHRCIHRLSSWGSRLGEDLSERTSLASSLECASVVADSQDALVAGARHQAGKHLPWSRKC